MTKRQRYVPPTTNVSKRPALLLWLYSQHQLAQLAGSSIWQYALELPRLRQRSVTDRLLQTLLERGLIEHRVETTAPGAKRRTFRRAAGPPWQERSCFVLTPAGIAFTMKTMCSKTSESMQTSRAGEQKPIPRFDASTGELWYDGTRLKRFPFRNTNTVFLLSAFELFGWTEDPVDNPLPGRTEEPIHARRLHQAIRHLNCGLKRIRFEVLRGGRQVRWLRI